MPSLDQLAVVIPVGTGDTAWKGLLPLLAGLPASAEVLLSMTEHDAQGRAKTTPSIRVIRGPAGRGQQLNAGAAGSTRPWLWFLHADSRFDASALRAIERLGDAPALGYFDLHFHDGGNAMCVNALGAWLRSRLLGLPFGDQGLLLPRVVFNQLGGFDEQLADGEDHALVWTARRAGVPLRPLRARLSTSARKYSEQGWWQTTAKHLRLTCSQARQFSAVKPLHERR
ncbi:MAG: glycosyl transferase family 2 [Pseudomarimonas sp.]